MHSQFSLEKVIYGSSASIPFSVFCLDFQKRPNCSYHSQFQVRLDKVLADDAPFDLCSCQVNNTLELIIYHRCIYAEKKLMCTARKYNIFRSGLSKQLPCFLHFNFGPYILVNNPCFSFVAFKIIYLASSFVLGKPLFCYSYPDTN